MGYLIERTRSIELHPALGWTDNLELLMNISDEQVLAEAANLKNDILKSTYQDKVRKSRRSVIVTIPLLAVSIVSALYMVVIYAELPTDTFVGYAIVVILLAMPAFFIFIGAWAFLSSVLHHIELVIELNSDRNSK
jgi:hypothetical protein